jgi:regulator of sirC expression with transglutaminase-like and TPR domain
MKSLVQRVVSVAIASLTLATLPAAALEATERELVRAMVEATAPAGSRPDVDAEVARVAGRIDAIVARIGRGKPTAKRARRLHRLLHRDYPFHYDRDADALSRVLDDGTFNCLSASLLYGTITRSLGYRTQALSRPGHLLIRLGWADRSIDVETTLPGGFDSHRSRGHDERRRRTPYRPVVDGAPEAGSSEVWPLSMSLEAAVGLAWLNRSWHDLDRGAPLEAALGVERALERLPGAVDQIDGARMLLARAFSVEYDAGRFENAFEIAAIDAGLFPERTTARDRLVAAAIKRIESSCDADDPARALEVLDAVKRTFHGAPEFLRLERRTYPGMAAAAVRLADWDLAREIADRYAAVHPDPRESARLLDWVEAHREPQRRSSTGAGDSPPVLIY